MGDMREKLAELIRKANTAMWGKTIPDRQTESRFIADYLIENGVILPPCKVGDTVYKINEMPGTTCNPFITAVKVEPYAIFYKHVFGYSYIPFDQIGKTVFLTKEEAQKAIDERS